MTVQTFNEFSARTTIASSSGRVVSFIDVPGHIRFLRNMLAGVGSIDGTILVIDGKEGWMPQT
ncbi:MAG: GTP-binding protein, partial [Actinomycetota bacterium]